MTHVPEQVTVQKKARRMARARRSRVAAWRALLHVGVLGWVFILPVVLGVVGGRALELKLHLTGATVAGLLLGLTAGGYGAWRQVRSALAEGEEEDPS